MKNQQETEFNSEKEEEQINPQETEQNLEETEIPNFEELFNEEKNKNLRLYAEFDNFRKRTQKEKMEFFKYASEELMKSLLPIVDDFERAIKELEKEGESETLNGVKLIHQKFQNTLKDKGLKAIEVEQGADFDVEFHEAITQIPAPSEELKDKIIDVVETGYLLTDKVIRFTKVVIGK